MGVSGSLRDMDLTTLISILCNEGSQARLRVQRGQQEAELYFDEGNIVHIVMGKRQGEEVLYGLLKWDDGQFELERDVPAPARTVQTNWSNLVLVGMQQLDEAGREAQLLAEKEKEEQAMSALEDMLHEMAGEIPGFIASDVVGMDGLSVGSYTTDRKFDSEAASAQFALVMKLVQRTCAEIKGGEVEDNLVTTDRLYITTRFLGDGSYYVAIAVEKSTASLGNVRLVTRRYAPRLWNAIPK